MIIDHGNKFIPSFNLHYLSFMGKLAMPLFAFIFGYSLNYFELGNRKKLYSLLIRLLFTALIASLPYIYLQKNFIAFGFLPVNIMFMFLITTIILYINTSKIKYNLLFSILIFITSGLFIEFYWTGLLITIFSYYFVKKPNWTNLLPILLGITLLIDLNGDFYAFLLLPIIYFSQFLDLRLIRIKHIFYYLYPLHLFIIAFIKASN
jgi:hypothetical protein